MSTTPDPSVTPRRTLRLNVRLHDADVEKFLEMRDALSTDFVEASNATTAKLIVQRGLEALSYELGLGKPRTK